MRGSSYFDMLKGWLTLAVLCVVSGIIYQSWNSWPPIEGVWRMQGEAIEFLTFTNDGRLLVTESRGVDVPLGTYTQDGPYIKVVSELILNSKDDGHNRFTLKAEFSGPDTFTTDGPIGLYVFERKPMTLNRISDAEAKALKDKMLSP